MKPVRSVPHSPNDESPSPHLNQNTSYTIGARASRVTEKESKKNPLTSAVMVLVLLSKVGGSGGLK